ncbi:MAG: tRNA lysidine(34) synthetase TilS [Helicobacter sp.]|nr:tRNA lysidine(34) synthetase TilS [Helicobacter sp.]
MEEPKLEFLEILKEGKNLLAFSSGADSTALYFLLKSYGINFDIAIVDYGIRCQSILEIQRAKTLCFWDNRQCHILKSPKIQKNFEHNARIIRYDFFQSLALKKAYTNIILAHQLDDKFEWFLMQFCKGTNIDAMLIQSCITQKIKGYTYNILRPMLGIPKKEILDYLKRQKIFYFEDFSNFNTSFRRNYFRRHFTHKILGEFKEGIAFSFKLLEEFQSTLPLDDLGGYYCFNSTAKDFYVIDLAYKKLGYILSKKQKFEIQKYLHQKEYSLVFGNKIALEKRNGKIYIFPYFFNIPMNKQEKERYRKMNLPIKFRQFYHYQQSLKNLSI